MSDYGKDALKRLLLRIDEEAYLELGILSPRPKIVIAGGSALLLSDLTARMVTHDVDYLLADNQLRKIIARYHAFNNGVGAYSDSISYNFEARLTRLDIPTQLIDYLTPSQEDIAVMKLYGWRGNDQEDLNSPEFIEKLDWSLLDHLVFSDDEAKASMLIERRYLEMRDLYINYAREHGHAPKF